MPSCCPFQHGLEQRLPLILKTVIDVSAAAILLALAAPVFLAVALLNRWDGGPVFFAHRRLGAKGRSFPCLKFRTMVVDGDRVLKEALAANPTLAAEWAATQKLANDPRVTPIGKILRKTSLDELPQTGQRAAAGDEPGGSPADRRERGTLLRRRHRPLLLAPGPA